MILRVKPHSIVCKLLVLVAVTAAGAAFAAKPLVYCADASPEGFDPALWDSSQHQQRHLADLPGPGRLSSAAAPSWCPSWPPPGQVSPDAKTFSFTLRRGVKFHTTPYFTPTREFNADDVMFSFTRLIDPTAALQRGLPGHLRLPAEPGPGEDDRRHRPRRRPRGALPAAPAQRQLPGLLRGLVSPPSIRPNTPRSCWRRAAPAPSTTSRWAPGPTSSRATARTTCCACTAHPGYWRGVQRTERLVYAISREPNVRVQKIVARRMPCRGGHPRCRHHGAHRPPAGQ